MTMMDDSYTPKGWQCPVCGRVYSPTFPWCVTCGGEQNMITVSNLEVKSPKPSAWPDENWYAEFLKQTTANTEVDQYLKFMNHNVNDNKTGE